MDAFHFFLNQLFQLGAFFYRSLKEQLVMHLQDHFGVKLFFRQAPVDADHRQLDQIGGGALQRRIERGTLGKVAELHLRRIDFRNRADSSEQSPRHAGLARLGKNIVQVLLHAAIAREIGVDEFRGFLLLDAQLLREPEWGKAVNDAEVDGLGGAAVLRILRHWPHAENFLRRPRVDVFTVAESLDQHGVFRKMRHNAQLDLRIVRREQYLSFLGDEGGANLPSQLGSNRNVLQVGIARTEAARGRTGLRKAGVQTSGFGMDQFWKRIHISRFELGDFAVLDDLRGKRMLRGQFLEYVRGGRPRFCFSAPGIGLKIQFVKKNFRELRRRVDVEFRTRKFPDLFFQAADFLFHRLRHFAQLFGIDSHANPLDIRKHRRERQVYFFVDAFELLLLDLRVECGRKTLQIIGALAGPAAYHLVELPHHRVGEVLIRQAAALALSTPVPFRRAIRSALRRISRKPRSKRCAFRILPFRALPPQDSARSPPVVSRGFSPDTRGTPRRWRTARNPPSRLIRNSPARTTPPPPPLIL